MRSYTVQIADSMPAEPAMSQEYFNAKYKAWLRRRGFDQEANEMEQRTAMNKRRRGLQYGGVRKGGNKP
jgi:CRISPR/Cas system-associated exonuclease Cas4 (RecB family)